ncbi:MAG: hypothetical protein ACM3SU_10335 [Acidobacteriota bacterium]
MKIRSRHYWRRRVLQARPERFSAAVCDAPGTIARLSARPQPPLSWLDRLVAFLTTPFKFLGISGWEETGCAAEGAGQPVRDAQHSTDGFWTIDVELAGFRIGSVSADPAERRFLRLEVEPRTKAHDVCARTRVLQNMELAFGGAVVVDTDGPFLEVHPEEDFRITSGLGLESSRPPFAKPPPAAGSREAR